MSGPFLTEPCTGALYPSMIAQRQAGGKQVPEVGVLQWLPALNEYQAVQVVGRIYLALPIRGVGVSACPFERSLQSPSRSESQPSRKGCFESCFSHLTQEPFLVCDECVVFRLSVL